MDKNARGADGDIGKKKEKKCFIVNKEAYERINYLYQVLYAILCLRILS